MHQKRGIFQRSALMRPSQHEPALVRPLSNPRHVPTCVLCTFSERDHPRVTDGCGSEFHFVAGPRPTPLAYPFIVSCGLLFVTYLCGECLVQVCRTKKNLVAKMLVASCNLCYKPILWNDRSSLLQMQSFDSQPIWLP